MLNKFLLYSFSLLFPLSVIKGVESNDGEWLASRLGGIDAENAVSIEVIREKLQTREDHARLIQILHRAKSSKEPLSEQNQKAVVLALRILSASKIDVSEAIVPLLDLPDRQIRTEAAQSLTAMKSEYARDQLAKSALARIPQVNLSNVASQQEALDFIRCALLAEEESKRDSLVNRLIYAVREQKMDAQNRQKFEALINEIRIGVASVQ